MFSSKVLQFVSRPPFKIPQSLFVGPLITSAASSPTFFFFAFNAPPTLNGLWLSKHSMDICSYMPLHFQFHHLCMPTYRRSLLVNSCSAQLYLGKTVSPPIHEIFERGVWFLSTVLTQESNWSRGAHLHSLVNWYSIYLSTAEAS